MSPIGIRFVAVAALLLALGTWLSVRAPEADRVLAGGCPSRPPLIREVNSGFATAWYDGTAAGKARAQNLLAAVEKAAQRFSFMQRPLPDSGSCSSGGGPLVDFYLVEKPRPSFWDAKDPYVGIFILPPEQGPLSGFVEIADRLDGLAQECAVAHAYFHLMQVRYGAKNIQKDLWWYEGTANYAEFLYDKRCPPPRADADKFMGGINRTNISMLNRYPQAGYGWLWPLFLQNTIGKRVIRAAFEKIGAGTLAVDALDDQLWDRSFAEFALAQFNKGKTGDFKRWDATGASIKPKHLDANLDGKPVRENSIDITVQPGATEHVMVDILDVNTRYVTVDVSDFTAKKDAHLRVVQQPTKGPNPRARAEEWDDGVVANWDGARKKVFCRDDKDEDFQQVLLAFSNTDPTGEPIEAKIRVKSEATCRWQIKATVTVTGAPPPATAHASATGTYTRVSRWTLKPEDEPVKCPASALACVPFSGNLLDAVSWTADETFTSVDNRRGGGTRHLEASGQLTTPIDTSLTAGKLHPPVIYQSMAWDADLEAFRPVISVSLVNSEFVNSINKVRTPAAKASWSITDTGECGDVLDPDWVFTGTNDHGRVVENWTSCLSDDNREYGVKGPLFFDAFGFPNGTRANAGNPDWVQICPDYNLYIPWGIGSGGPCWELTLDPYATAVTATAGYTAKAEPVAADATAPAGDDLCVKNPLPCPVHTGRVMNGQLDEWPLTITLKLTLERLPNKP